MGAVIARTISEVEKLTRALEKAKWENARLRSLNQTLVRNNGMTFESSVEQLKTFLQEEPKRLFNARFAVPAKHKPRVKTVFDRDHSEIATLMLSDLHTSETVQPLEINGMNKFNPMVLSNRLWTLAEKFMKILRGHQCMYPISKIWLPVLGDMISGSIHPELALTNALLDYPSTVLAARLTILLIERLKTLGLPVEVDCVVGNHARQLAKLTTKKQGHLSLDWLCYVMIAEHFREDSQVSVHVYQSQFALVEQFGHRFVLEHGAGAKFSRIDELESRIRNIFDNKVYRDASGLEGSAVDCVLLGDKHRASFGPGYVVNGCLPGSSEITTSWRLSPIKSEQVMFGISKKKVRTWSYVVDLTECVDESALNPFGAYTKAFMETNGR